MSHILVVDGSAIFRMGLREVLKVIKPHAAIHEAGTLASAQNLLRGNNNIELILLDIGIADGGGLAGFFRFRKAYPGIPIIVLSEDSVTDQIDRTVALGAVGYIQKSAPSDAAVRTLITILSGQNEPVPVIASRQQHPYPIQSLSPALLRVLTGIMRGLRNKEIAFELGLSEKTIKAYLGTLYRKLGVNNRAQAIILAQEVLGGPQDL